MTDQLTRGRYPGYDVLAKRNTLSWNDKTREVIDARLSVSTHATFFSPEESRTLQAVCERVVPQPEVRPSVPIAAHVDRQLMLGKTKGYRLAQMPQPGEAWKRGLAALNEAAMRDYGRLFSELTRQDQDALLGQMAGGKLQAQALQGMPPESFWSSHVLHDVAGAYYAHPSAWSEIGWGGPASPRGYVRLGLDRRDSWEPEEGAADEARTRETNQRVR